MVVSQNRIAADVGAAILRKGGNAVDAAIATAFALAVTLPRAGNVGGGGYMLIHMAPKDGKPAQTIAIDWLRPGVAQHDLELLLGANGRMDPAKSYSMKGVAIPGTVAGLWEAHKRFGSLPWGTLIAPAIAMARDGVILSDDEAQANADQKKAMHDDAGRAAVFFKPDGSADAPGERWKQPDLAASLQIIAAGAATSFYTGRHRAEDRRGDEDRRRRDRREGPGRLSAGDLRADLVELSRAADRVYAAHPLPAGASPKR